MKRLVVIAVLSALTLAGCKTTESNYRESYEAAVRSRNAAEADLDSVVEPTIHNKIMEASRPYVQTVDGCSALYLEGNVWQAFDDDVNKMKRYSVVVGAMRQMFNAKAFCTRLRQNGAKAYVIQNGAKDYFVVAEGFDTFAEAADYVNHIDKRLKIKIPLKEPFVYRTIRL
ncbi:MAG: hypothetical protein EGP67_04780 [Bacteroidales bacterium]|jgi:hypothetical protein|uniref:SPOR domain-containing protein n=1 Tax=Candidatus Limisoma sp. TaxID=3076476 RepID=UPI00033F677C|nr:hypothetical protein [Porphyromonadaceae bacterium]MBD9159828.1 hypothetical protein [Bacteroidales bacterium]MBS7149584.1 SPOR domain-containing protein [Prevotella sp.]CDE41664.1 lipoprotein [Prevotella sp. CAG:279]MBD9160618.1 hypothetical protein [Bacteroidales bacterium]